MRIGVVHTEGSPCGCAEAVSGGIRALGHEVVVVNSEEIEFRAAELARACDLVIDHTDTFRGRGLLRAYPRFILEAYGARIVGSDARACFAADNKVISKACLGKAGLATPPGVVITSPDWEVPPWLTFPLVLKPAFEHMSRGIAVARTEKEARRRAVSLLKGLSQPIVAESFIFGREIAVSVLEGSNGLEMLPPVEWKLAENPLEILSETFKLTEQGIGREDAFRAQLSSELLGTLSSEVHRAFKSLGLRDYARFDIRLSPGGTFYFLEANVTPSLETGEALALSAHWAGLDYPSLVERMLSAALNRLGTARVESEKLLTVELPTGPVQILVPKGVHVPPPSTLELARLLDVQADERVLELGCGTGIISIAAARLGARHVVATDIDTDALQATLYNARLNGVEERVEVQTGSWYEAIANRTRNRKRERYDVIVATPPQTPGPVHFGPRYGGADGTRHLLSVIDGAHTFLVPSVGRLWILAITLANPEAVLMRLKRWFTSVVVVRRTERPFTWDEYESMEPGLSEYLLRLRSSGRAEFHDLGDGRLAFHNLFIRASKARKP